MGGAGEKVARVIRDATGGGGGRGKGSAFEAAKRNEPPRTDADIDLLAQQALIQRMRSKILRGTGRAATIGTSPLGVTTPVAARRKMLKGTV